jgi:hypothetical protein
MQHSPSEMGVIFQTWRPSRSKKEKSRAEFEHAGRKLVPAHLVTGLAKIFVDLSSR